MAEQTERFDMRLPKSLSEAINEWRRQQPDLPSKSEAIRQLIVKGLDADRAKPPQ